ncbi:MAG TPA: hypothetical protein VG753_03010 [Candidatus Paceibacterota bacterium]|nr:hypothetical protein [Candidatus Paceibacterota bacterium]
MKLQGKRIIDFFLIPAIVVLVGVAAFGLGRLSAPMGSASGLVIHPAPAESH